MVKRSSRYVWRARAIPIGKLGPIIRPFYNRGKSASIPHRWPALPDAVGSRQVMPERARSSRAGRGRRSHDRGGAGRCLRRWSGWLVDRQAFCQLLTPVRTKSRFVAEVRSTAPCPIRRGRSRHRNAAAKSSAPIRNRNFSVRCGKLRSTASKHRGAFNLHSDLAGASQRFASCLRNVGRGFSLSGGSRRRGYCPWRQTGRALPKRAPSCADHFRRALQSRFGSFAGIRGALALALLSKRCVFDVHTRARRNARKRYLTQGDIHARDPARGRRPCLKHSPQSSTA